MFNRDLWAALAVVLALLSGLATLPGRTGDLVSQGEPSARQDGTIVVGDPCDSLSPYEAPPDIAYQPGVDVDGNPVAPADLAGSEPLFEPDHKFDIPLTVPLGEATDVPAGSGTELVADSDIRVGDLTVVGNDVSLDGRPLDSEQDHALAEACARQQANQPK